MIKKNRLTKKQIEKSVQKINQFMIIRQAQSKFQYIQINIQIIMGNQNFHNNQPLDVQKWVIKENKINQYKIWTNIDTHEDIEEYQFIYTQQKSFQKMKEVYFWRKNNPENLVTAYYLKSKNERELCSTFYKGSVFIEAIPFTLSKITDIPYPDSLYLFCQCFKGFAELFDRFHFFQIQQNMICITKTGQIKVWMNSNRSQIQTQVDHSYYQQPNPEAESLMVRRIIELMDSNIDHSTHPENLIQYLMRRNPTTFQEGFIKVQQYAKIHQQNIGDHLQCIQAMNQLNLNQKINNNNNLINISDNSISSSNKINNFINPNYNNSPQNIAPSVNQNPVQVIPKIQQSISYVNNSTQGYRVQSPVLLKSNNNTQQISNKNSPTPFISNINSVKFVNNNLENNTKTLHQSPNSFTMKTNIPPPQSNNSLPNYAAFQNIRTQQNFVNKFQNIIKQPPRREYMKSPQNFQNILNNQNVPKQQIVFNFQKQYRPISVTNDIPSNPIQISTPVNFMSKIQTINTSNVPNLINNTVTTGNWQNRLNVINNIQPNNVNNMQSNITNNIQPKQINNNINIQSKVISSNLQPQIKNNIYSNRIQINKNVNNNTGAINYQNQNQNTQTQNQNQNTPQNYQNSISKNLKQYPKYQPYDGFSNNGIFDSNNQSKPITNEIQNNSYTSPQILALLDKYRYDQPQSNYQSKQTKKEILEQLNIKESKSQLQSQKKQYENTETNVRSNINTFSFSKNQNQPVIRNQQYQFEIQNDILKDLERFRRSQNNPNKAQ